MPNEMAEIADDFEEFWTISTRRIAKGYARLAYVRARRKASKEEIHEAYRRYCVHTLGTDPHYIAHPSSWLNAERWTDEADSRAHVRQTDAEDRIDLALSNLAHAARPAQDTRH